MKDFFMLFILIAVGAYIFVNVISIGKRRPKNYSTNFKKETDVSLPDNEAEDAHLPYIKKSSITSKAEYSFYKVIEMVTEDKYQVCPKVSLSDIFETTATGTDKLVYFNKISRKHVDFLICDKKSMSPIYAIELDDSSHKKSERAERDDFVNRLFEEANLKLLRYPAKAAYDLKSLQERISQDIQKVLDERAASIEEYICPNCKVPMVRRVTKRGPNTGKEFYGCSNFPQCKEIISID